MATAKKSKKSVKKSKKSLRASVAEHGTQVQLLGQRLIAVIEKGKFHPVVALDALQLLLSAGVGAALGDQHQQLFDAHIHRYHEESKMLSILEMFGGLEDLQQERADGAAEPTPETPKE